MENQSNEELLSQLQAYKAKCSTLEYEREHNIDKLREIDGIRDFTELLGQGEASEYDTELDALVREAARIGLELQALRSATRAQPSYAEEGYTTLCQMLGTDPSCRGDVYQAVTRLQEAAGQKGGQGE